MNTTQTPTPPTAADIASTSRGFGRLYARTTVGSGPAVCAVAVRKARAAYPQLDAQAFLDGFRDERSSMRGDL